MARIVLIAGSPSETSRLAALLRYASTKLNAEGIDTDIISVRDLPAEDLLFARFKATAIVNALEQVERADALIIGTPIYKASFSGILKAFLDLLPTDALKQKPVLPIATGGTFGHLLALDYALKPIFSALGARHIEQGVFALESQIIKDSAGDYEIQGDLLQRIDTAVIELLSRLKNAEPSNV